MDLQARQQFLANTTLLGSLPSEMLEVLARDVTLRELSNGETLIEQGQDGSSLYIVVDGRLEARKTSAEQPPRVTPLGHISRGEAVGELAVLSGQPAMCSVVAIRESRVLALRRVDFLAIVAQQPAALFGITQELIRRMQEPPSSTAPVITVALIPHSPRVDIERFTKMLYTPMCQWGTTGIARTQDALKRPPEESLDETLAKLQRRFDRVIYQGMSDGGEWSRCIVRQADLILVVANAQDDPSLSDFEASALFGEKPLSSARVDLVLLHPDRKKAPRGTARWLDPRKVHLHHHIAMDAPSDFGRLARIITGNSIHVVLSGGGVRGFAHVGVLRAMQEARVPVDIIGGTSIGAGIAVMRAMKLPTDEMVPKFQPFLRGIIDLTLPMLALFSGKKVTRAMRGIFGDQQIEDLWLNCYIISADLQRAEEVVHRRGPIWLAIRATGSVPGLMPPVISDGRYLVDGGVLNNMPVDVMAALHPGRIVAVDVSQELSVDFVTPPPMMISGWRLLWRRLNPFRRGPRDPQISEVLMRSSELASVRSARINKARTSVELYLRPPVAGYRMLDLQFIDAIVEAGYKYAIDPIVKWATVPNPRQDPRRDTVKD